MKRKDALDTFIENRIVEIWSWGFAFLLVIGQEIYFRYLI